MSARLEIQSSKTPAAGWRAGMLEAEAEALALAEAEA